MAIETGTAQIIPVYLRGINVGEFYVSPEVSYTQDGFSSYFYIRAVNFIPNDNCPYNERIGINYTFTCPETGVSYSNRMNWSFHGKPTLLEEHINLSEYNLIHPMDGSKTYTFTCILSENTNYPDYDYLCGEDGSEVIINGSITKNFSVECVQIATAHNFTDEDNPTITFNEADYNRRVGGTYSIYISKSAYAYISLDGTTEDIKRDIPEGTTKLTFNLTTAERQKLINSITKGTSRTVTFGIHTLASDVYIEEGGTDYYSTVVKTFTIKGAMPTLAPVVKDVNSITKLLTGNENTIVKYFSNVQYEINATASKGATINHQQIACGGKTSTAATGTLYGVESGKFLFTCSDTRDNIASQVIEKNFIDYTKLTCNVAKKDMTASGSLTLSISGNYFNGSFGAMANVIDLQYRVKVDGGEYGAWMPVTATLNGNTYKATLNLTVPSYKSTYTYQAVAADRLDYVESEECVVKFLPVFDWGESDFNFNIPVNYTDTDTNTSYSITDTVKAFDGVELDNLQYLNGLTKALTKRYELPCEVGAGLDFSSVECNLYLYGNTIRGYLNCVRKEASGTGDLNNRIVCGVTFDSGGKVVGFGQTSFCSGGKGTVATFSMADTVVYANDGSVDESQVGKGYFNIYLTAAAQSATEWQCFFTFPAIIDLSKY